MFDIGFLELLVCAILALLVLGPERLPKAARTAGLLLGKVRRSLNNMQDELERQVRTEELREKLKDPYATFMDDDSPQQPQSSPATLPQRSDSHTDTATTPSVSPQNSGKPSA